MRRSDFKSTSDIKSTGEGFNIIFTLKRQTWSVEFLVTSMYLLIVNHKAGINENNE